MGRVKFTIDYETRCLFEKNVLLPFSCRLRMWINNDRTTWNERRIAVIGALTREEIVGRC